VYSRSSAVLFESSFGDPKVSDYLDLDKFTRNVERIMQLILGTVTRLVLVHYVMLGVCFLRKISAHVHIGNSRGSQPSLDFCHT